MKTNTLKNQTKLTTYLALTAGAGLAATAADGATVVTFYGPGATSPNSNPQTPLGINFKFDSILTEIDKENNYASVFRSSTNSYTYFTRGSDIASSRGVYVRGIYRVAGNFVYGAVAGDANYANISFNGNDKIYEAVAQFHFGADGVTGVGQAYLIAIAKNSDNTALSISAGKAAIDAVPEPSSLALLALGSAGLLARRNRKLAA